jgi:hypothetical protein
MAHRTERLKVEHASPEYMAKYEDLHTHGVEGYSKLKNAELHNKESQKDLNAGVH